jgi:hypothetical protein
MHPQERRERERKKKTYPILIQTVITHKKVIFIKP